MTAPVVYDATAPAAYERTMGPGPAYAHIQNPDWPNHSLCLVKLSGVHRDGAQCPDCLKLAGMNRAWIAR